MRPMIPSPSTAEALPACALLGEAFLDETSFDPLGSMLDPAVGDVLADAVSPLAAVQRVAQGLGAALTVVLLATALVSARQSHEAQAAVAAPATRGASVAASSTRRHVLGLPTAPAATSAPAAATHAAEIARGDASYGEASYYASSLAGNPTASGEPYLPEALTAAHRTLPLGSQVRVTNLASGHSVTVRINDRGPFAGHRVIDLSHAAARRLGMLHRGRARVSIELLGRAS